MDESFNLNRSFRVQIIPRKTGGETTMGRLTYAMCVDTTSTRLGRVSITCVLDRVGSFARPKTSILAVKSAVFLSPCHDAEFDLQCPVDWLESRGFFDCFGPDNFQFKGWHRLLWNAKTRLWGSFFY